MTMTRRGRFLLTALLAAPLLLQGQSVAITPTNATVAPGGTVQFNKATNMLSPETVTWSVNGMNGGASDVGTISTAGLYKAPAAALASPVTVRATSDANPALSAAATVTVAAPPTVTVTPSYSNVKVGSTLQLTATVKNLPSTGVTWSVAPAGMAVGSTNSSGLYTAPATIPAQNPITVKALSTADGKTSGVVYVNLLNDGPLVTGATPNPLPSGTVTLTVTGSGFKAGATILLNGVQLSNTGTTTANSVSGIGYQVPRHLGDHLRPQSRLGLQREPDCPGQRQHAQPESQSEPDADARARRLAPHRDRPARRDPAVHRDQHNRVDRLHRNHHQHGPLHRSRRDAAIEHRLHLRDRRRRTGQGDRHPRPEHAPRDHRHQPADPASRRLQLHHHRHGLRCAIRRTAERQGAPDHTRQWRPRGHRVRRHGRPGTLTVVNGPLASQPFPVQIGVANPAVSASAARRFLEQAAFGPTPQEADHVQSVGFQAWINEQFNLPQISNYNAAGGQGGLPTYFIANAVTNSDQLGSASPSLSARSSSLRSTS